MSSGAQRLAAIAPEQAAQSPRVSPCPGVTLERPGAAFLAAPPGVDGDEIRLIHKIGFVGAL
ncbi:hypothetical protein SynWH8101_1239 [Synechococcus sp. WH 8101]|nr:hypothetical protein SynWH8101_1239 [Synechococcus sp. WH 8101]QNI45051.1 hypothetical protein SynRCC2555_01268 [Synechococcus sp. WH 8101]